MARKKRKWLSAAIMLGLALAAAGCGGEEDSGRDSSDQRVENEGAGTAQEGSGRISLAQGECLYVVDYREFTFPESEWKEQGEYIPRRVYADSWGEKLYMLTEYVAETEDGREQSQYLLHIFDGSSCEVTQQSFPIEIPEEYAIFSMEAQSSTKLSFRLQNTRREEERDILLETDMEGNVTAREELFPEGETYPWNPVNTVESSIKVYDNPDGSTILSQLDTQDFTSKLFWYDKETKGRRLICEPEYYPEALYLDSPQILYYAGGGSLVRLDLTDQTENAVFSLQELSEASGASVALIPGTLGELYYCVCGADGDHLDVYTLSNEEPEAAGGIRMAYLWGGSRGYASAAAAQYSLAHQDCPIQVEEAQGEGDEENFKNRILMELAAGKGPELLWVFPDDLEMLTEKGILMDMRELIPEELLEKLFPCVIEAGTVDGTMVALVPQFTISSLAVSDKVWEKDSWTLSEFLDVVESRDDWEYMNTHVTITLSPMGCLRQVIPDLTDTPFLDMEQGKAHFDHEDFFRAIELCKKYGAKEGAQTSPYNEKLEILERGDCVAQWMDIYEGFPGFSKWMAEYSGICHFAGYPNSKGLKGNILCWGGLLAVNAKAEHLEEIKEYIALLLAYENQLASDACCARKDVITESVVMMPAAGTDPVTGELIEVERPCLQMDMTGKNYLVLEAKPDGSSYLEEYLDFLENCSVDADWPAQIDVILSEELAPYFAGDREAKDAVANIQNRVQLYLDER